jgi:C4-type Zn-finger protein
MQLAFFINTLKFPPYAATAKVAQIKDWIDKVKPFGEHDVTVIMADENKLYFINEEEDLNSYFDGDYKEWVNKLKTKLKECPVSFL